MTRDEAINILWRYDVNFEPHPAEDVMHAIDMAIEALKAQDVPDTNDGDMISKKAVLQRLTDIAYNSCKTEGQAQVIDWAKTLVCVMPSARSAPPEKYEYHYDHTDCIWYRPEARNRCPATCAQYRDGWNDAMNYIFRDGKGYRPYRRDKQYEE